MHPCDATVVVAAPSVKQACMRFPQDFNTGKKTFNFGMQQLENDAPRPLLCLSSQLGCMHASNFTPQKNWSQNGKSKH
jgi:hypothetical protein